jgi:purine-binding chemotaxis protein CheW
MTSFSSLRSRRFTNRPVESTVSWVTFWIYQEGFALPITAVQQVVTLDRIYGDPGRSGLSLTRYRDQELLVVDVGYRVFGDRPRLAPASGIAPSRLLLVVQNSRGDIVGIPIDSPPSIRRLNNSAVFPIPDTYLASGNLRCLTSQRVKTANNESFFVLDADALTQPELLSPLASTPDWRAG